MRRTIVLTSILVTSITGIAFAQSIHQGDPTSGQGNSADSTFASQMMQAMDRMNAGMAAARPTGDPDRDFAAMMIPHHQGAIDMAKVRTHHVRFDAVDSRQILFRSEIARLHWHNLRVSRWPLSD
jgi:hypothetical protein